MQLTVHCLVKNEEKFIGYALRSVAAFAEKIFVFDTGSTDETITIVKNLQKEFPQIILEQKGKTDYKRHTELRQEMIERTATDWFMILDGDEIWTNQALREAVELVAKNPTLECLIAPFYLCVGDVYHFSPRGMYTLRGKVLHATPRFFKKQIGMVWKGEYNQDAVYDKNGVKVFEKEAVQFMQNKFWHVSHLTRSSKDSNDFSSGSVRGLKRRLTYHVIGRKINEVIPEVFSRYPSEVSVVMKPTTSVLNLLKLIWLKIVS